MQRRISPAIRAAVLLITLLTMTAFCGCSKLRELQSTLNEVIGISDVPTLEWNESDPKGSYERLSGLLSELTPEIAVRRADEFDWDEVCKYNFWVDTFSVTDPLPDGTRHYSFRYRDDASGNKEMKKLVDAEADDIISKIPKEADEYTSMLVIHDELISRITYDEEGSSAHTYDIYGALVEHCAVCQGYTYSMSYIADRLGIECSEVSSEDHIWNKLPGLETMENYVDVTWDDIDSYDKHGNHYILHNCFCLTKDEIEGFDDHKTSPECRDEQTGSGLGDNYFRRFGAYIPAGNMDKLQEYVLKCYADGKNVIEMRFESDSDYASSVEMTEEILLDLGYEGYYMVWKFDDEKVLAIGLDPPDEGENQESEA